MPNPRVDGTRRHRCRVCGSRSLSIVLVPDTHDLRWRCRSCGAKMRYASPGMLTQLMWRKRRPLGTWLFGR